MKIYNKKLKKVKTLILNNLLLKAIFLSSLVMINKN